MEVLFPARNEQGMSPAISWQRSSVKPFSPVLLSVQARLMAVPVAEAVRFEGGACSLVLMQAMLLQGVSPGVTAVSQPPDLSALTL